MREFSTTIERELANGLRPEARGTRASGFLIECRNLMCSQYGLRQPVEPISPFVGQAVTFPFPQIVRWPGHSLLLGSAAISEVSEAAVPWTVTPLTVYDAFDPLTAKALSSGGVWHLADLFDAFYLFNGSCVVFRTGLQSLVGGVTKTFVQDQVSVNTGCSFKGRIMVGGFNSANVWNAEWQARFAAWQAQLSEPVSKGFADIGQNWVMWSSIGGGDFPLWLFYPDETLAYTLTADEGLDERLRRNEFGWMPMPFSGKVMAMKRLMDNVIVYGEDGIAVMAPISGGEDVPPTFGVFELLSVGIPQRGCVAGSDRAHVFMDTKGYVWAIQSNLSYSRLGFQEYLSPMLAEEITMVYVQQESVVYISSDNNAFILTNYGLTEHNRAVTSAYFVDGGVVGLSAALTGDAAELVTNEFDFSIRGIKTVTQLLVNAKSAGVIDVRLYYRYDHGQVWSSTDWMTVNAEGVARIQASGTDFRVGIRVTDPTNLVVDYIQVSYQVSDKRYQRGPYVDSDAAGAGGAGLGLL